ncbi:MAG: hypothetical protein HY829_06100 [Actinobacteria bacterium]|nr:hypothetical protein [Actinomycetota bacterium]
MPMQDFFGVLRRRWLIVLVGFLMTVGLSGAAYWFFKPTYEITGTVLLLPPQSASVAGPINPYLELGGLQQLVDLIGVSLTDQSTQLELQAISKDVDFSVKADVRTSSPLLLVDVKDSTPESAQRIRDILMERIPIRLEAMQTRLNITAKDRVTSTVVTLDREAEEVGKNRLCAAVVAGVAGLSLTLLVAALRDARRLRRARRLIEDDNDALSDPVTEPADPVTEPADPVTEPADPVTEPADPVTEPVVPVTEPAVVTQAHVRDRVPVSPVTALGDLEALEALEEDVDASNDAVH